MRNSTLPVVYKGKTTNGYHRYYVERPFPDVRSRSEYYVVLDKSRLVAWTAAWWAWLNIRFFDRETW